jgi:uncharacterized protein
MRFAIFFSFWFAILALAYWYVGRRVIGGSQLHGKQKRVVWILVFLIFLLPQVPFFLYLNRIQAAWIDTLSWAGYFVLGFFSLLFTLIVLRDVAVLSGTGFMKLRNITGRSRNSAVMDPVRRDRRRFLVHSTNIGAIGLSAVMAGYGLFEARRRATIEEVSIPIAGLPEQFKGIRIVQFTDLHVGPTIKRPFVERIATHVDALQGDLIVFTGDLVDGSVAWLQDDVAPLRSLHAPLGKLFITGNHEYYSGVEPWITEARQLGFDVLLNEHRIIQRGEGRLIIAGVTDYGAGDFIRAQESSPSAALSGAPEGLVKILLAHQPRSIHEAARAGYHLQISGHTHGGQFFPWNHLATLNQPYIKGLHRHENTWIYVSRGTGYWGPPLRIGIPPEITVITLTQA